MVENPPANAGDARAVGSIPGWWCCFLSVCVCVFLSLYFMLQALLSCLICSGICSYLRKRPSIGTCNEKILIKGNSQGFPSPASLNKVRNGTAFNFKYSIS